jgi:hypothetical protein
MLQTWLGMPHPSILSIPWCVCTHPINVISVQFLHCAHGNERTGTHDGVCNFFIAITRDDGFHVGWEQLYALFSTTFHSSRWWVDIVFTKDKICTLVDVVIINPTRANLFHWSCATWRFTTSETTQAKERNYCDWHPTDHFLPLAIEVFGCRQTSWCVLTWLCQCYVELQRVKGLSYLCLGYFSLSKNFNYITKDASILHLKSGDNDRCNYFPTSTPSKCIPPSPRLTSYKQLVVETKRFWHLICVSFMTYNLILFIFFFPCTFSRFGMSLVIKFRRVNTLNIIGDIKIQEQLFKRYLCNKKVVFPQDFTCTS